MCYFDLFLLGTSARMHSKKFKGIIYAGSFCEGISPILFCSQIFGIFPLKGIRPRPTNNVHFKWVSFATVICYIFITWNSIMISLYLYGNRHSTINALIISTSYFFIMALILYAVFFHIARRWTQIVTWWTEKEQNFLRAPYVTEHSQKLKTRIITTSIAIAVLAITEHGLCQVSEIHRFIHFCNITNKGADIFLYRRFVHVHAFIPGIWPIVLSQWVCLLATAAWNFLDLFIIIISIGITTRFDQLTNALKNHIRNDVPDLKSMLKFRMDFITICQILEYVDKKMGIAVFLSTINNLFFLCNQLLHAFNPLPSLPDFVFYWFSLLYLIGRTFYTLLSAAAINESAKKPKRYLHDIPQEHWNQESNRLLFQINSSTIALSAMGFWNFTRGLILTMAGTIVTFELVMMQFGNTVNSLVTHVCAS